MSSELSWVVHIKITRVVIWIVTRHRVSSLRCEPLRRSATRADVYPLNIDPPERALHIIWGSLASCGHARRDLPGELTRQLCYLNTYDRWSFHRFLAVPRNRQNRRFLVLLAPSRKRSKTAFFWPLQFYWIYCYWTHLWCCCQHLEGHFFTKFSLFEVL